MKKWLVILLCLISGFCFAAVDSTVLKKQIQKILPPKVAIGIEDLKESVFPNYYQFTVAGRIGYISVDGRYVILGDILDLKGTPENLTENTRKEMRLTLLKGLQSKDAFVLKATAPIKGKITVFTDVSCAHCQHLHKEIIKLTAMGVEVHYLLIPRFGKDSPGYRQAVAAWCNTDREKALHNAYQGVSLKEIQCDHPIEHHYLIGQKVGLVGTPSIVFADGTLLGGYWPADTLFKETMKHSPS